MSTPETPNSPQVKLMREWGQGFRRRDLDHISKTLHREYRHITYPRSLGKPELSREEWLEQFAGIMGLWINLEPTIHSITEAPGKVFVHITNKANTTLGVEMTRESIFIGHMVADDEGNLKIKRIEEFTDSKGHLDFTQAIAAAKDKKQ